MNIPRLKNGGQIAVTINKIIDFLPRLTIRTTPDLVVNQTPSGQLLTLREKIDGTPAVLPFPWQVSLVSEDDQMFVQVEWGTINGQEAFPYPSKKIPASLSGLQRVVLSVSGAFQALDSVGITNPVVEVESAAAPLEAQESGASIRWKIVLAFLNTTDDNTTISQATRGHINLGFGFPVSI